MLQVGGREMSSDRVGLMKSRAESFARHLQTRLKTLSESQDDGWAESGDAEVYYDIESPLEEIAEPIFIAAQNRDILPLERTDSETSTYYDTLESVEELKTSSPVRPFHTGSPIENGFVDFLDNNTSIDHFEISSILKLKNENLKGNINSYSDAGNSGTFDTLRLELVASEKKTDNVCDINGQEENNNIGKEVEEVADFMIGLESNNCDVAEVEVDNRHSEGTPTGEMSVDVESEDMYCVFCDIEQIKTGLASDCTEVCELRKASCESETIIPQLNGFLEEDLCIPLTEKSEADKDKDSRRTDNEMKVLEIPQIVVDNHISEHHIVDRDESLSLSNSLQELKIEITKESLHDKSSTETEHSARSEELSVTTKSKGNEVDEFDVATKRKNFQRSSSLKSGKTPPGTPGRKKIVRFADVLGLDLADVKTFLDEVPTVPKSAYEDLHGADLYQATESLSNNTFTVIVPQVEKVLTPVFQQPCIQPNFLDRVVQRHVCLENAVVSDMSLFAIRGLVRVKNVDFHKSVHVRYTINNWHSFSDLKARYVPNSCDGFSDKFSFTLYAHTLSVGQRLEFAVRFQTSASQYWDNNGGLNYGFVCNSLRPQPPSISSSSCLPVSSDDTTAAFY